LQSWDANGLGIVKIHCEECIKDFGGNTGEHGSHTVSNLFANFRKHHLLMNAHIRSLCRRQGLPYTDHPQSVAPKEKPVIMSTAEHEQLVREGIDIMDEVSDATEEVNGQKPFYVVDDTMTYEFKYRSYWFKVRCRVCGDFFQLCPPKRNLLANLNNHLHRLKHSKAVSDSTTTSKSGSSVLSTGQHGRPAKSSASIHNQHDLHEWFRQAPTDGEQGEIQIGSCPSIFSLMCWGYWGKQCKYNEKAYSVQVLLQDPSPGTAWIPVG
jgi:hypothetical protein